MKRSATTMSIMIRESGRDERGSALIIAVLVSVILSLLGISYMLMAQTENTIAENERNAAMALYVAQAGARLAVNWFNDPSSTGYLVPTSGQVDRTLRLVDQDNDPNTARVLAVSGTCAKPLYKDSTCTTSPILDRPYRPSLADTLGGIETGTDSDPNNAARGPDLVVSASHLTTINNTLFPNFPTQNLRARIARIEIYGPPIITVSGALTRMGVATVKVIGGVFIFPGTAQERQIATRVVKAVVNEIPVPGPVGPLQSCTTLDYQGSFEVHWGTGSSQGDATLQLSSMDSKIPSALPYALNDPFTYYTTSSPVHTLASWAADPAINDQKIDDPWFKYVAGGNLIGAANTNQQPYDMATYWPGSGTGGNGSHTNVFQNTVINCPTFDYSLWKSISQGGNKGNYYYKWSSGDQFLLDGVGSPVSFATATGGRPGIYFFDTTNAQVPAGDRTMTQYTGTGPTPAGQTNLTDDITITSSDNWLGGQGFIYLNAKTFGTTGTGSSGSLQTIFPPGEPSDSSGFVNLEYPGSLTGDTFVRSGTAINRHFHDPVTGDDFCTDYTTCGGTPSGPAVIQDPIGLPFQTTVVMNGVFYTSGAFSSQGNANFYGSMVANEGVLNGGGTPGLYFDESLIKGGWPRKGMNMPRVVVSSWQTDL